MTHKQEAEQVCNELQDKYNCNITIHAYSEDSLDVHIEFPGVWKEFDVAIFGFHTHIPDRLRQFFIDTVLPELEQIGYEIKAKENT